MPSRPPPSPRALAAAAIVPAFLALLAACVPGEPPHAAQPPGRLMAYAGVGGVAVLAVGGLVAAALLRRRPKSPRSLYRVLLAGSVKNARDP